LAGLRFRAPANGLAAAGVKGKTTSPIPRDNRVQDLSRKLRLFPATNIVIANMIGAGIFTTSGLLLGELGSPGFMVM
jgi:hypothetical protein